MSGSHSGFLSVEASARSLPAPVALIGVLRLRGCFASRSRHSAQDDTSLVVISDFKCAAALSGVMSRCGVPSISNPTINFLTVAERSSGG